MKLRKLVQALTFALLTASSFTGLAQGNLENDPAYLAIDKALDLKSINPEVNVNLPRFLLQDALAEMNGGPDDPLGKSGINLAELVKDIKLIRVLVFEHNEKNKDTLKKGVAALRSTLDAKWTAIVSVPEENVGVYAMGDPAGESIAGLAVVIQDDGDTVIVNIVGRVSLSKIIKIASNMDKFPKDLLKKLGQAGGSEQSSAKSEKAVTK